MLAGVEKLLRNPCHHVENVWRHLQPFRHNRHWTNRLTDRPTYRNPLSISRSAYTTACWRETEITSCRLKAATICPAPCDFHLWPFDLESGVRITCDECYLCANCSLPRPPCSRLSADVRDRQTDRRQTDRRQSASLWFVSDSWVFCRVKRRFQSKITIFFHAPLKEFPLQVGIGAWGQKLEWWATVLK